MMQKVEIYSIHLEVCICLFNAFMFNRVCVVGHKDTVLTVDYSADGTRFASGNYVVLFLIIML